MDLEGIVDRVPSTEKILGVIWILSWILAIWIYHLQFFLTGLFCLFLILILIGRFDKKEEEIDSRPSTVFSMDKNTRSLKVQKLYEEGLKWDELEICSGAANLPDGVLKEGDTIKNCKGNIALRHIPSNTIFGAFNFEE